MAGRDIKVGDTIHQGEWYYICCIEDFQRAEQDEVWDTQFMYPRAFANREEGLAELDAKWLSQVLPKELAG